MDSLSAELRGLAERYAKLAVAELGDNLTSVVLFGSVARGEPRIGSDIDLLVICRSLPRGAFRRREFFEPIRARLAGELESLWVKGAYTDIVEIIRSEAEASRFHLLYLDLTEDAVLLFDRGGFFESILDRVRQRLRQLGARRKTLGKVRYWDLKPDLKPGEAIEL